MSFLTPVTALIAAAVAVPALVLLYFLKLRRKQLVISSTLLWKKAIQDMQVNAPFQKMRRNLLLLLQLLILAALLFALARPAIRATAQPGQRVAILVDASASMNAADTSPSRLAEARRAALDLVANLEDGATAMVVAFAERPSVMTRFTTDRSRLRAAVRAIEPTDQVGRLEPALRIIEPEALEAEATDGQPVVVYVISDGRVDLPAEQTLALRGADLRYLKVGSSDPDNVGLVSFSARRDLEKPQIVQVYARVYNAGAEAVRTNLSLKVDGSVAQVQPLDLGAGGSQAVQFDFVMPGAALVEIGHDHDDALAADDAASLVLAPARRLRVLLVGEGNAYLEHAARSAGVRRLVRMTPKKYEDQDPRHLARGGWDDAVGDEGFDVIIFDAYAPQELPVVDSLYFGVVPPIEGLEIKPSRADAPTSEMILDWDRGHPLMRYVVLDDVILSRPGRLALPDEAVVLATGRAGPILARVRHGGVSHVVASFDVLNSNWPLFVSFPVFVSNALTTLGIGESDEAGIAYRTGEVAVVAVIGDIERVAYTGPTESVATVRRREAALQAFSRVGVYRTDDDVEARYRVLPVNLLSEIETDLRPADVLEVAAISAQGQARTAAIRREVWPWFAWGALAVLMIEWFVYTRRMHI